MFEGTAKMNKTHAAIAATLALSIAAATASAAGAADATAKTEKCFGVSLAG